MLSNSLMMTTMVIYSHMNGTLYDTELEQDKKIRGQ